MWHGLKSLYLLQLKLVATFIRVNRLKPLYSIGFTVLIEQFSLDRWKSVDNCSPASFYVDMRAVNFPDWLDVLEVDSELEASDRESYLITIRWFLGYCKRRGCAATVQEARAFVDEMGARKRPKPWVEARWKAALNWFFLTAKRPNGSEQGAVKEPLQAATPRASGVRGPAAQTARLSTSEPEWKLQFIRGVRIRQFSYETEKAYLNWMERFARFVKTDDFTATSERDLHAFLDHLAVHERVSAGTQRQALNALVFFFRDVSKNYYAPVVIVMARCRHVPQHPNEPPLQGGATTTN